MNDATGEFVHDLQIDPVRRFIHDVNNHLGTAIGFTVFLTEDLPMPSPAHHHALRVQEALLACRDVVSAFAARQARLGKNAATERPCLLLVSTNVTVGDAVAAALEAAGLTVASCRSMTEAIEILRESLAWDGVMANIEDRDILTYLPSRQSNPLRLLYGGVDDTVAHVGFSAAQPLSEIARLVALLLRRG